MSSNSSNIIIWNGMMAKYYLMTLFTLCCLLNSSSSSAQCVVANTNFDTDSDLCCPILSSDDSQGGWYDENLKDDARWADYRTPPESNANYAWILHMLSHLKPLDGVAGFLLANGALGDSDTVNIRQKFLISNYEALEAGFSLFFLPVKASIV